MNLADISCVVYDGSDSEPNELSEYILIIISHYFLWNQPRILWLFSR